MSQRSTLLLEHHLKELKLPSFLREYGKLAAQCATEGVDHPIVNGGGKVSRASGGFPRNGD